MESFLIEGGHQLSGTIMPQGAKNEALEVISAIILTKEEVIMENVPNILDVNNLIQLLKDIGVKVKNLAPENLMRRSNQFSRFCLKTIVSLVKKANRIPVILPRAVAVNSC